MVIKRSKRRKCSIRYCGMSVDKELRHHLSSSFSRAQEPYQGSEDFREINLVNYLNARDHPFFLKKSEKVKS
jgi:hypothetical protein